MAVQKKSAGLLQQIFREISDHDVITLRELARVTWLRPATLRAKLRSLERKGLVKFPDVKRVAVNPDFGYVVGIDMGASHLHFALADFRGEILGDSTEKVQPEDGPHRTIGQIKKGIRELATPSRHGRLRALAIGVPSPVDTEHGVVAFANNLPGWKNIHLGHELEKEFRVPVFMENDANMAAIGERWRGVARGVNNFVFIALGTGIGSGIFADGKLYRGRTGSAGEVFKLHLEWPRWAENFPDTGYFENFVAGLGIAAEGRKVLGAPPPGDAGLREERDAYFVFEAMRQGNPQARALLEKTFTMLGVGVANVVAVLDPDLIVFGGGVVKGAPDLLLSTVEKVVHTIHPDSPALKLSHLGDKAQTYGAIFSALTLAQEAILRRLS